MTSIYRLGGIDIASEMPLAAPAAPQAARACVEIRYGSVPTALPDCRIRKLLCEATQREFLLRIPNVASYWVRDGEQIVVEAVPGAVTGDVAAYLLSYAFAALCQQRGLLVLQAAALEINAVAVLLLGPSGCGKSTLAAELAARGYTVLCDDVCLIEADASSTRLLPSGNRLGLWPDALDHFEWPTDQPVQSISSLQKYSVKVGADCAAPLPVGHLLFLHTSHSPRPVVSCEEMRPVAALAAAAAQVYLPIVLDAMGERARSFQQCASLLQRAAGLAISRHWNLGSVSQAAQLIQHLLDHGAPDRAPRTAG